ncbi:MAG: gamma-glutamyltransferase, partial [Balneolaceae bacterium]
MNSNRLLFLISPFILSLVLGSCDTTHRSDSLVYTIPEQPELPTGFTPKPGWAADSFAVAAANPLATDAGYQILKAGGSAVDAAIAVQLVLSLTEPQSSGIGGGAFLLTWDGERIHAYNGRETAPSNASETMFLDENGVALPFGDAVRSGLSVGVPGTVALLKTAHDHHGLLPWPDLFQPAITLSEQGFRVSPRLHSLLEADEELRRDPIAASYFYDPDGVPVAVGETLYNPAYAQILRNIAQFGISEFYEGIVAEDIVHRVKTHQRPGTMVLEDIVEYPNLDLRTEAMCNNWRRYRICGFPPPASGHITIMQILGIIDHLEKPEIELMDGLPSADWLHNYLEAS